MIRQFAFGTGSLAVASGIRVISVRVGLRDGVVAQATDQAGYLGVDKLVVINSLKLQVTAFEDRGCKFVQLYDSWYETYSQILRC